VVGPAAVSGDQDPYDPTNHEISPVILINASANARILRMTPPAGSAGAAGAVRILVNRSAYLVTLVDGTGEVPLAVTPPRGLEGRFTVGEAGRYRVALAVEERFATVMATDLDIWSGHPEKSLTCSEAWAAAHPEILEALCSGLMRAAERCDDGGQREALTQVLSQPQWLGTRAAIALQRQFEFGAGTEPKALLRFNQFHADRACVPNPAEGAWLLSQFSRWGWCPFPSNRLEVLGQVYRPDLCAAALQRAGLASVRPTREAFALADGLVFDQDDPLGYLKSLPGSVQPPVAPVALPVAGAAAPHSPAHR
jgi:nitrate/nitrite transport system ATP-binding protein